jgi:hypothetical protein
MQESDRQYFNRIYALGKRIAPKGDDDFIDLADELLIAKNLPDRVAAVLQGLSGYVSYLHGSLQLKSDQISEAIVSLESGQAADAEEMLKHSQGDYSASVNRDQYFPRIVIDNSDTGGQDQK